MEKGEGTVREWKSTVGRKSEAGQPWVGRRMYRAPTWKQQQHSLWHCISELSGQLYQDVVHVCLRYCCIWGKEAGSSPQDVFLRFDGEKTGIGDLESLSSLSHKKVQGLECKEFGDSHSVMDTASVYPLGERSVGLIVQVCPSGFRLGWTESNESSYLPSAHWAVKGCILDGERIGKFTFFLSWQLLVIPTWNRGVDWCVQGRRPLIYPLCFRCGCQ